MANKLTKKEIYAAHGVVFDGEKILCPEFGYRQPLLKEGNTKTGKKVFTWSTLPTNKEFTLVINGKEYNVNGTCPCHCKGCYATKGKFNCDCVMESLAVNTILIRNYPDFVTEALIAQIEADRLENVRIDAAGDIENGMITVFRKVAEACPQVNFWSYTKNKDAENAFDDIANTNIVKSIIPNIGFNFGHCDHIINAYNKLVEAGESVYICRCGIDKEQHCENCKGCSVNKYVLFIEHSTEYKATKDPLFEQLKDIIEKQPKI